MLSDVRSCVSDVAIIASTEVGRFFLDSDHKNLRHVSMTMRFNWILIIIGMGVVSTVTAQSNVDSLEIAEMNRLGALLHAYDQAAWHGSDAIMPLVRNDDHLHDRVEGYVVEQTEVGWQVGFGRLTEDGSAFAVALEVVLDEEYGVLDAVSFDDPDLRTGFYRVAMAARNRANARFDPPEQVMYNTAVIPGPTGSIYIYFLPAQPAHRVYYLGGDVRYTYDPASDTIIAEKPLHSGMLTIDLRGDHSPASMATAVLTDIPTETDVFYARSRPAPEGGLAGHYVITQDWVFVLDSSGIVEYMTVEEFGNMIQSPDD